MAKGRWAIRLTGLFVLAFVPLVFFGKVIAQEKEDTALFYQGQSLMEKKQPQGAAAKFDELLEKYPNSNIRDLAAYWLGRAYLDLDRISEAETVLQQLQREFPDSPLAPKLKKEIASKSSKPQPPKGARDSIPGGIISYQLTAINSGSGIARNVVITDLLPSELEYVNSDPQPSERPEGGLVWQVTELAPNQKKVFVVNVRTRAGLRAGTVIQKETRVRYSDLNGNRYE